VLAPEAPPMGDHYFFPPQKSQSVTLLPDWSALVEYPLPATASERKKLSGRLADRVLPLEMLSSTSDPFRPIYFILTGRTCLPPTVMVSYNCSEPLVAIDATRAPAAHEASEDLRQISYSHRPLLFVLALGRNQELAFHGGGRD